MKRKPQSTIGAREAGLSLVSWLSGRFTYFSEEKWLAMIAEGRVSVDGQPAEPGRILAEGELVLFDPPPVREPEVDERIRTAYEDERFLIVEKSGSLPCHPGGSYFMHTLWGLLRRSRGEEAAGDLHIATRLDRETSGLVLLCKGASAARFASEALAEGRVSKEYLALVHGRFPETAEAKGRLVVDASSAIRKKRLFVADGEEAPNAPRGESCETRFESLGSADVGGRPISLVRALPRTGRTHQIRASLLGLGYPIVGDKLYGLDEGIFLRFMNDEMSEEDLARLMLPGQALHCAALSFEDESGKTIAAASLPGWPSPFEELLGPALAATAAKAGDRG